MKFREFLRFDIEYQLRRSWTWAYLVALLVFSYLAADWAIGNARAGGYSIHSPFINLSTTVLGSAMALLVAAAFGGDAGARDVQTRMHPLVYACRVSKRAYLGGRFLAALVVTAIITIAPQIALLVATLRPGLAPDAFGVHRPAAYLSAWVFFALPNAFIATALLFAIAVSTRRAVLSYVGAVFLFFMTLFVYLLIAGSMGKWELARILDPLGFTVMREIARTTTAAQKNALEIWPSAAWIIGRAVWIGVAFAALALTYARFRFADPATEGGRGRPATRRAARSESFAEQRIPARSSPIYVPRVRRSGGIAAHLSQARAIAVQSFREIALGWGGAVLAVMAGILVVAAPQTLSHLGIPRVPTTAALTSYVGNTGEILWTIVPILTVFYVGELVWRDRESRMSEISDAMPVPEWVRLLGRYLGLVLVFVAYQVALMLGCMLVQIQLDYHHFEIGLYARILLGLQLSEHLLFALLAFAVHVLVNQKYIGHLVLIVAYAYTAFAPYLGIADKLLVYGSAPDWSYSDMRGFGLSFGPWMWFKVYWGAWAILLAVVTKLFWVRGRMHGFGARLRLARPRLTVPTMSVAGIALAIAISSGAFIFHNTNVLNAHEAPDAGLARSAAYERQYGKYEGVPQPQITGVSVRIELYPGRPEVEVRGTYRLVNRTGVAIDSIHFAPDWEVENGPASLDRPATLVLDDRMLGHRIYDLATPLPPGDSLRVEWGFRFKPRGFTNDGIDATVAPNGTFFEANDWFPGIGYQHLLEISAAAERKARGLPPRPAVAAIDDLRARMDLAGVERIDFDAIVGTEPEEIAVAPGALRRMWTERGRRYFHYVSDAPIPNDVAVYSAAYVVREAQWNDVSIQVLHHPGHERNVDRMIRGAKAALEYCTRAFGPYPYRQVRIVERPGRSPSLHAYPVNVAFQEGLALLDPARDPRDVDFLFVVLAHEIAHYWWGHQVSPANVEGAPLLSESLAWYSAFAIVEETYGAAHLQRLLGLMREAYESPMTRADLPLLRAYDRFNAYRKGPFAMLALREYLGAERVDTALRRVLAKHGRGRAPLPTSLDLYHELQAVTPDSLRSLLADLFEQNTYWEMETDAVEARQEVDGSWRVNLDVKARKVAVDTMGAEVEIPMNDLVEVGVYGSRGSALHRRMHRVRSGAQRIVVAVPSRPDRAGIDPRMLLIDVDGADNVREVRIR